MNIKSNLKSGFADQKSRVFLFIMVAIIVVVSFVAYTSRDKTTPGSEVAAVTPASSVVSPGSGLDSTPGIAKTTKEYKELQERYDQQKADQALKKEGQPASALPSLQLASNNPIPSEFNLGDQPSYNDILQKQLDEQKQLQARRVNNQQLEFDRQQDEARNKQIQKILGRQTQVLAQNWQVKPQTYVDSIIEYPAQPRLARLLTEARGDKKVSQKPKIYYKAGDILFGVILTSINSDEPGPILARIISGPLGNSKIIGSIDQSTIPQTSNAPRVSKSLILNFNLLNIPDSKRSISISAIAIDPQTARSRMVTSVDSHYFMRYGTFFAAEFLAGLGQAISSQNQSKIITDLGSTVNVGSDSLSGEDEAKIAIGRTAEAISKSLNFLDTPPTIKIASGTPVGLLLLQDLVLGGDEAETDRLISQNTVASAGNPAIVQSSQQNLTNVLGNNRSSGQVTAP